MKEEQFNELKNPLILATKTCMVISVQPYHSGEPTFSKCVPPVLINSLQWTVEPGTYVSYLYNNRMCYGRLITSHASTDEVVTCCVNKYEPQEEILMQLGNQTCPPPIGDRYIGVKEIFQTSKFVVIDSDCLVGIIFVFQVEQFTSKPYKETENIYDL